MKTYVYEETEVKLTGRTAIRKIAVPGGKTREMVINEITPCEDLDWKKWVPMEQLYEIQGDKP